MAWLRRWFFRRVDAVLTAGHASTEAVLAMGVPAERIVTGFNSVDVRTFHEGAVAVRAAKPRAGSGHAFLYVGQLIERKNVSAALAAFARVAAVEDTFDVVGTGPLAEELQERAGRLGVADRVRLVGHREGDGLIAAYANADTLVLPSTEEVWGLVVNEALAAGLHVVVSDCAGVVPSVRHMPGVFVAAPTVQGLAEAMEASRAEWQGPIEQPLMLEHTPERAAEAVLQAVEVARHGREAAR